MEEIYACTKHIGFSYQDTMSMPTLERRAFLSLLINENTRKSEMMDQERENMTNKNAKGTRTTRIGGDTLKTRLKNGEIPNH